MQWKLLLRVVLSENQSILECVLSKQNARTRTAIARCNMSIQQSVFVGSAREHAYSLSVFCVALRSWEIRSHVDGPWLRDRFRWALFGQSRMTRKCIKVWMYWGGAESNLNVIPVKSNELEWWPRVCTEYVHVEVWFLAQPYHICRRKSLCSGDEWNQ